MKKIYIVIHESNVDGETHINVVPCSTHDIAETEVEKIIDDILSEGKFAGLDLGEIELAQFVEEADCDYILESDDSNHFFLATAYDDYYEKIDIIEKEIKGS